LKEESNYINWKSNQFNWYVCSKLDESEITRWFWL